MTMTRSIIKHNDIESNIDINSHISGDDQHCFNQNQGAFLVASEAKCFKTQALSTHPS